MTAHVTWCPGRLLCGLALRFKRVRLSTRANIATLSQNVKWMLHNAPQIEKISLGSQWITVFISNRAIVLLTQSVFTASNVGINTLYHPQSSWRLLFLSLAFARCLAVRVVHSYGFKPGQILKWKKNGLAFPNDWKGYYCFLLLFESYGGIAQPLLMVIPHCFIWERMSAYFIAGHRLPPLIGMWKACALSRLVAYDLSMSSGQVYFCTLHKGKSKIQLRMA